MKKFALVLIALILSTAARAQYEAQVPDEMMNLEHAQKADSLGKKILSEKGSYPTAIELFKRSATIHKHLSGVKSHDYYTSMALLAKCYLRNNQIQDAINVLCSLSDTYKGEPLLTKDYAIIMDNLSLYYAMADQPDKALEASKEVMRISDGVDISKNDKMLIFVHAAENYSMMKDYQEAIRIQLHALNLAHQLYGMGSETYIGELKYLQQYYEGAGETAKAKKTAVSIESLEKPGGGVRPLDELNTTDDCAYHRGDAYWCAEYYLTHALTEERAFEAGQYATKWCMATDELTIEIDERHTQCIGDCPTELAAFLSGCLLLGQSNEVSQLTREMERQAMDWTVRHYYQNREFLVKPSPELDQLVECLKSNTLEAKLLELIPNVVKEQSK